MTDVPGAKIEPTDEGQSESILSFEDFNALYCVFRTDLGGDSGDTWAAVPARTWAPIPEDLGTDSGGSGH